jgi:hydroxymethylpyrimidine pyrophosphatase-like HAD family hydrolase
MSFAKRWLVLDMDGTITSTPTKGGGHYLDLTKSPCMRPLARWLQLGGSLFVVSTAGKRMWRQVHEQLQPHLVPSDAVPAPGRLVLCGFSGAAMFHSQPGTGELLEERKFRSDAVDGGTVIDAAQVDPIIAIGRRVVHNFFRAAAADPTLVPLLSRKYHAPYTKLLATRAELGEQRFHDEVLTADNMLETGRYMTETNDRLIDRQVVPDLPGPMVIPQFTVIGIPMARFGEFFTADVLAELRACGVYAKAQPNSVVVARQGINKATAIQWLADKGAADFGGFDLRRAVAFGDSPEVVDRPMTVFPPMPFVSLAMDPSRDPPGLLHVGGEEEGTAHFVELFTDALVATDAAEAGGAAAAAERAFDADMVRDVAAAAKARLNAPAL